MTPVPAPERTKAETGDDKPFGPMTDALSRAAQVFKQIKSLEPGRAIDISAHVLADCHVPANPLDRQTPEFILGWMRDRLWFRVKIIENMDRRSYTVLRVRPVSEGERP